MDCELGGAPAWSHSFCQSAHLGNHDLALHLFLVDVVNAKIGDGKHTLLRPLQVVDLFDHRSIHQGLCSPKSKNIDLARQNVKRQSDIRSVDAYLSR